MIVSRDNLKKGMKVKTIWKNKIYEGVIINNPKEDAKESAVMTKGRFIAVKILDNNGKIVWMPYTRRAQYEILQGE